MRDEDATTLAADDAPPARENADRKAGSKGRALHRSVAAEIFERLFGPHDRVLLAVSGGADSLAMLLMAAEWARLRGAPKMFVATVDHGLRPEAEAEIANVARVSAKLGLPHARLEARLSDATGIEEKARDLRIAKLVSHAEALRAGAFATAHTLDDQAETVLMRLAAGSGPSGLTGMAETVARGRVAHVRPFLGVAKASLTALLEGRRMRWAEDPMNADRRFARARLRGSRAALEREGMTAARLVRLAFRMARVNDTLEAATRAAAKAHLSEKGGNWMIAPGAAGLPDEIKLRLLALAVGKAGSGKIKLERLERLADRIVTEPQGAATLAGARIAWTREGRVSLTREPPRGGRGAADPREV